MPSSAQTTSVTSTAGIYIYTQPLSIIVKCILEPSLNEVSNNDLSQHAYVTIGGIEMFLSSLL